MAGGLAHAEEHFEHLQGAAAGEELRHLLLPEGAHALVQRALPLRERAPAHEVGARREVLGDLALQAAQDERPDATAEGVLGAAIATTTSFGIGVLASIAMGRSIVAMPIPWRTLSRCGVACGVMAAVVSTLPALGGVPELILKGGIGAAVYAVVVLTLNAAGVRDVALRLLEQFRARRATA
jgi:hypothetical protein